MTASGSSRGRRCRWAHPQSSAEAHGGPIGQPDALPVAILDGVQPRRGGDLGPQESAETLNIAQRIACRIEQAAHQRIAPQTNLARLGLEYGLITAIDERDGHRAQVEERILDGVRVETA